MKQVKLGASGLSVGTIAYGCWRFAGDEARQADRKIRTALDHGMTLIDTADIYGYGEPAGFGGAEVGLGEVLAADPSLRARMVLATKGGVHLPTPYKASGDYLAKAVDASLSRLGVDHIDLYQVHRPDLLAAADDTARALNDMVSAGKVGAVGVSNYTPAQTRALAAHLSVPIVSMQPEFSVLQQAPIEDGVLDWCAETGAACLCWSPLAGGQLFGDGAGSDPRRGRVVDLLDTLAAKYDADRACIALAFVLRHPSNTIPIIGTQKPERIASLAKAADITLEARDWYDIGEAYRGEPMP